ncbi:MAG: acetyl-CoA decarbonylase/synthase complex subunit alpha/beta [Candidatus Bathyarchaeia archaeon]
MGSRLLFKEFLILARDGAEKILSRAVDAVSKATEQLGKDAEIILPGTVYGLPLIYGLTGRKLGTLEELRGELVSTKLLAMKKDELTSLYNSGLAALMAMEVFEAIKYSTVKDHPKPYLGFISDTLFRELSLSLADGTVPGIAILTGRADEGEVRSLVEELRDRSLLTLLAGPIIGSVEKAGYELGLDFKLAALGEEYSSIVYAADLLVRTPLMFGGVEAGDREEILSYVKHRVPAFMIVLKELSEVTASIMAGFAGLGVPIVTDVEVPQIPRLILEVEDYRKAVEMGCEVKGIKVKRIVKPPIPVDYGPSFEGERIRRENMYVEFGGGRTEAFELVRIRGPSEVSDGRIDLFGLDLEGFSEGSAAPLGIIVDLAGKDVEKDLEAVLERRIHQFLNRCKGLMHIGSRDEIWIRISKEAVESGFKIRNIGDILYAMYHSTFPRIVEKVQVSIITDPSQVSKMLGEARLLYMERDKKVEELTEEEVDAFYGCTLCQSFAPTHVCVITPERISLCGATSWLDAKISYKLDPSGPNFIVHKGRCLDPIRGEWTGVNETVLSKSHGSTRQVYLHSMFGYPHTSCGCFEAIAFYIPEVDGIGVVHRGFKEATVNGMTFSTMAGFCGGGKQVEGFLGIGTNYLRSRKFLTADGGFKRIVWMTEELKEKVRESIPRGLYAKIATERGASTIEGLRKFLEEAGHPVVQRWSRGKPASSNN